MRKVKKMLLLSVSSIIVLFHVIWIIEYRDYSVLLSNNYANEDGCWIKKYNKEYYYSICPPHYPNFNGNYIVARYEGDLSLIIWPPSPCSSEWEFGVDIYNTKKDHGYRFYINDDCDFDTENKSGLEQNDYKDAQSIYSRFIDKVKSMKEIAKKEFPGMPTIQRKNKE